jgi:hypothetical protein
MNHITQLNLSRIFLRADENFEVTIKLLSKNETKHRIQRGTLDPHFIYGTQKNSSLNDRCLFDVDSLGFHNEFLNQCLLITFITAIFYKKNIEHKLFHPLLATQKNISLEGKPHNHFFLRDSKRSRHKCLQDIKLERDSIFKNLKHFPQKGPYSTNFINDLSDYYNVQSFVYKICDQKASIFDIFPSLIDETKPSLHFLIFEKHMYFIKNKEQFFRKYGFPCYYCGDFVSANSYCKRGHNCTQRKTCLMCRRFVAGKSTYMNEYTNFCSSLIISKADKYHDIFSCKKCHLTSNSEDCFHRHKCTGFFCVICKRFENRSKEKHKCNQRLCLSCFEYYSENSNDHICRLKEIKGKQTLDNMAFLTGHFNNTMPATCLSCQEGLECTLHKEDLRDVQTRHAGPWGGGI